MRVLGVEIAGKDIKWIIVDGDSISGKIEYMPNHKIPLPQSGATPGHNYSILLKLLKDLIENANVGAVGVIKASNDSGVERAKIEGIFELACVELNIDIDLIHILTINNCKEKKFPDKVGDTLENSYNNGVCISPKYLTKSFYCAWSHILNG